MEDHNQVCTMPEHGSEDAPHACCRPKPAAKHLGLQPGSLAFWTQAHTWKVAARNTFSCLVGCMIGDISAIVYLQRFHPDLPMWITMSIAMAAGLITSILFESALLRWREGFRWKLAFTTALSMSFLSMLAMEAAANATDLLLTGGRVPMHHPFYWQALAISVLAGFLVPLPYNYYKFQRHGRACH